MLISQMKNDKNYTKIFTYKMNSSTMKRFKKKNKT